MSQPAALVSTPPATGGRLVTPDGRVLPLRGVSVTAEAGGGLARVVLEQRFHNPYPEPLHVTYLLPLPVDGVVSGFAFRVGERRVVGEIDRRAAARERFEQALIEGRTAALAEQDRGNLFGQELGNLPPGAEVVAELEIDQRLGWLDDGAWEWRFPTVVAPRYLGAAGRVPDGERVAVDVTEAPLAAAMRLTLLIRDAPGGPRAPESPSHAIRVARIERGLEVTLGGEGGATLDRDVVVRWTVAAPETGLALDTGRPPAGDAAYGLVTLVPPPAEQRGAGFPRDLIVLLDASGSMSGEPLDQARGVVAQLVDSLDEADRLELIAFSERPWRWQPGPVAASAATRAEARRWLDDLRAGGGTEMRAAVSEALRPLRADAQRQVVLVTDGLIGFESEIVAEIARELPAGSRFHTVGVGEAVNRALTAPAARAGRGAEVMVGLGDDAGEAARRLVARTRSPLVCALELGGSALLEHAPARIPDVLASGPVLVAVRLRPEGGEVHARGRTPAGPWTATLAVPPVAPGAGRRAVVTLFGREAVEDLEVRRVAGASAAVDGAIERLGLDFQIATRSTSWVAVSETPSADPRVPWRRERIPHALPHGLSIEGLGLREASMAGTMVVSGAPAAYFAPARAGSSLRPLTQRLGEAFRHVTRPKGLTARLVRRAGRELMLEIALDRTVEWRPTGAEVEWADGTRLGAAIDGGRTTRDGRPTRGQVVRLALRLAADGPPDVPLRVVVTGGGTSLTIDVRAG
jgi:Ca-activated chloride channel family protein